MSTPADRAAKIKAATPAQGPNKIVIATVVAVIAIVAIVAGTIWATRSSDNAASAGGGALPKGAAAMGAGLATELSTAPAGAPTVDIYEDFQCPVCGQFEKIFGESIRQLEADGKVQVRYHVLTFLDGNLRNDSSSRAANAAMCAADQGKFAAYHDQVYANQPAKEGTGYTDAQLKTFAEGAGLGGSALTSWETCVKDKAHNQYIESVQTQADKDKVNGTPTVRVQGKDFDLRTVSSTDFAAKVLAAAGVK